MKNKRWIFIVGLILLIYSCKNNETLTDVDGNVYKTIKIGNQIWMAENLRTTKYLNGNPIYQLRDAKSWSTTQDGAYCTYNNDSVYLKDYGRLYNWHAVSDPRGLAPEGWHIPRPEEIATLIEYLKGDTIAAGKMKIDNINFWLGENSSTNESGFSALPGGYRFGDDGSFHTLGSNGYWWTSTQSYEIFSWSARVFEAFADVNRDKAYMNYGLSVRCIKNYE